MMVRSLLFVALLGCFLSAAPAATDSTLPARLVTLSETGLPLSKALAEIEKQMGMRKGSVTDRRGEGDPRLKVSLQNVPFWKAIDAIANEVGASVYLAPRDGKISLVKRVPGTQVPISYSGPFRLAIKRVTVFQDLESNTHHATASIEAAWEPQVQPFLFQTRPQNLVVKDDKDRTLPFDSEGKASDSVDGRMAHQFDVVLPAPSRAVTEFGLIEGSFSALAPSKMLTFRFGALDRIAQAPPESPLRTQKLDGITCRITRVALTGERWTIQVTQDLPPGPVLESFRAKLWSVNNAIVLESKDGSRRLTTTSYNLDEKNGQGVFTCYFVNKNRGKPSDWNLLYTTPASVVVTPIPFRFKNVPLP